MTNPISRLNAALEGRYSIERELGEGGMANVYLADDVKHDRKVAIKVLKPELAAIVGAERFLAEIKTTANLQHPHVLPLHDSGEADGFLFYVMPYVAGESLRDKLDREKQLSVQESLAITRKVADALDYAHELGVVHRDIKPANILLSERGEPLVADFGIALAVAQAGGGRITETGLSLGTPHYMSPEQATGDRDVDPRSDVYALGCVLYEMLAGQPPFAAPTAQAVLVQVLTKDVTPITSVRRTVPPHVESVLARALEKLPADRFENAAQFRDALDQTDFQYRPAERTATAGASAGLSGAPATASAPIAGRNRLARLAPWGIAAAAIAIAVAGRFGGSAQEAESVTRVLLGTNPGQEFFEANSPGLGGLTLTPDGMRLIYRGPNPDPEVAQEMLWARDLSSLEAVPIPGTEGGAQPQVSRDGRSFSFTVVEPRPRLGVMPIDGGTPLWLEEVSARNAWGDDGAIYFADEDMDPAIRRWFPGEATASEVVPALDRPPLRVVDVLPGSRGALLRAGPPTGWSLLSLSFDDGEIRELDLGLLRGARFHSSGHLTAVRQDGALLVAPFDPQSMEVTGPVLATTDLVARGEYAIADDGTLVYELGTGGTETQSLVLVDRSGSEAPLDWIESSAYGGVAISPDGTRIAAGVGLGSGPDIWVYDLETGTALALTRDGISDRPVWHPNGDRITFTRFDEDSPRGLWSIAADGSGSAELLLAVDAPPFDAVWRRDGSELVVRRPGGDGTRGIFRYAPGADGDIPVIDRAFQDTNPQPSPDGRWIVYTSNETGVFEVFAQPYPDGGTRVPISIGGGESPSWSTAGSEVFYVDAERRLIAASVSWDDKDFRVTGRDPLFDVGDYALEGFRATHDVLPDGRFLMIRNGASAGRPNLVLVRNWGEEIRRLGEGGR